MLGKGGDSNYCDDIVLIFYGYCCCHHHYCSCLVMISFRRGRASSIYDAVRLRQLRIVVVANKFQRNVVGYGDIVGYRRGKVRVYVCSNTC